MKKSVLLILFCLIVSKLSAQSVLESEGDFPTKDVFKVFAYPLDGNSGSLVVQNGKLSPAVTDKKGIMLTDKQQKELLALLENPSNFGGSDHRCFEPHIGFVFFNNKKQPIAHISVSFDCNDIESSHTIEAIKISGGTNHFSRQGIAKFLLFAYDLVKTLPTERQYAISKHYEEWQIEDLRKMYGTN
jgi:hypothetical protein